MGAILTEAFDFKDTDNPTIKYDNPAGASATTLQAGILVDSAHPESPVVAYRDITKTADSYTFSFTDAERNALRNIVGSTYTLRTVYFSVKSVIDGVTEYSTKAVTFFLTENEATKPSVTLTATPSGGVGGLYVVGKSRISISVTGTGKYGASISSYFSYTESESSDLTTWTTRLAVYRSGSIPITATVTDSRGFTTTETITVTAYDYALPRVAPISGENYVRCFRVDENDNPDADGTYIHIQAKKVFSSVNSANACTLRWQWNDPNSVTWSDWESLTTDANGEYDSIVDPSTIYSSFTADKAFNIRVGVVDLLSGEGSVFFIIPAASVTVHLAPGGGAVGVGRYIGSLEQNDGLKVAMAAAFENGLTANNVNVTNNLNVTGNVTASGLTVNGESFLSASQIFDIAWPVGSVAVITVGGSWPQPPSGPAATWSQFGYLVTADTQTYVYFAERTA